MMVIEHNTDDTFETVRNIAQITWPDAYSDILSTDQLAYMFTMMYSIKALREQTQLNNHHFILAKEGEDYLGFASYEFECGSQRKTKIHKLYILPLVQGRGVGRFLMEYIESQAQCIGDEAVFLNVNRNNNAVHFYKKVGYAVVKEEDIAIGNGYLMEDYVMEKRLLK
jgi:diamine N-acetyltransferase